MEFDEYVWFDQTRAVIPLDTTELKGLPDTYPRSAFETLSFWKAINRNRTAE
jgi:hypothetical protein